MAEIVAGPAKGKVIEVWFQDEARIGQKNKITRRWAKRGSRPSAPHDQRTRSAYIFGAICPKQGKAAGPTVEDNVDRKAQLGTRVLINDGWYKSKPIVVIFSMERFHQKYSDWRPRNRHP
ncbi:transposase [Rhizobium sp. XQZ8]|nr:transposase [Rhizobium populisoli]